MTFLRIGLLLVGCLTALAGRPAGPEDVSLNGLWSFRRDGGAAQTVRVPHDWAIGGRFASDADGSTGALPWQGTGEYGRTFSLDRVPPAAYLRFDGVMARPRVRLNGRDVGGWDYGYMSFVLDVRGAIRVGTNELVVTADTRDCLSRWYPGGGLYRDVRLLLREAEHVVPGSLHITTPVVTRERATVKVSYASSLKGPVEQTFEVAKPRLWDVDDPYLYTVEILGEKFRYGIRTFAWTADDGFHLNGRRLQIRGVNLHADLGLLGMAFDRDAARRQLEILRDMGVNAIRTSHNPPAPAFLDLCDEMGFVVWNECFDKWNGTAGIRADECLEEVIIRNLCAFVRRDRNHSCVVAWSVGNEIELFKPGVTNGWAETGMTLERSRRFCAAVRSEDATRPVGVGCCHTNLVGSGVQEPFDLTGWNYTAFYRPMKARYPDKPVVYSESASAVSSSGCFVLPLATNKTDYAFDVMEVSSYDRNAARWSDIPDWEFARLEQDRYCAGEFVWTGIDYLGEPTPYSAALKDRYPWRELARSSYFGICDLCVFPKDRYWLYRSVWRPETTTVHLLPHWNWRTGDRVPVCCYTNGDEAELFLNGRSLGRRRKDPAAHADERDYYAVCARYRLQWTDVAWEPGRLEVVAYRNGRPIGKDVRRTCGHAQAVKLTAERPYGRLRFVDLAVTDAEGTEDPLATDRIALSLEGPAELVAFGNANPRGRDPFRAAEHPLYFGRALAIVRLDGRPGRVTLTARSGKLRPARLNLQ